MEDPAEALKKLLKDNAHLQRSCLRDEIEAFAKRFEETHELRLIFNDEAADVLIDLAVDRDKTIRAICEERFKDFEHGLKIVSRNTEETKFVIDGEMAREPDRELSKWVVESFKKRPTIEEEDSSNAAGDEGTVENGGDESDASTDSKT